MTEVTARKTWVLQVHECLCAPAHLWIWLAARLLGLDTYHLVSESLNARGKIKSAAVFVEDKS